MTSPQGRDSPSTNSDFEHVGLDMEEEITPAEPEPAGPARQQPALQQQARQGAGAAGPSSGDSGLAGILGLWGSGSGQPPEGSSNAAAAAGEGGTAVADPMRELEEAAAKVADQARHAAQAASFKLKEGAAEAKESLKGALSSLSSWWAQLEPGNQFGLPGVSSQSKHQDYASIQAKLGLDAGEAILESFQCQLLQEYACTNNPFTPPRQVAFSGELHITSSQVCFVVSSDKSVEPVKLQLAAIKGVRKLAAADGLPDRLVLLLSEGGAQSLVFTKFTLKELEMDSALALLEHLTAAD